MPADLTSNGERTFIRKGETNLVDGDEVTYTCHSNYQLSLAQSTSMCTSGGSWDPPIDPNPMCHPGKAVV